MPRLRRAGGSGDAERLAAGVVGAVGDDAVPVARAVEVAAGVVAVGIERRRHRAAGGAVDPRHLARVPDVGELICLLQAERVDDGAAVVGNADGTRRALSRAKDRHGRRVSRATVTGMLARVNDS